MSGGIRKALGPARKRTKDLLAKFVPEFDPTVQAPLKDKIAEIKKVKLLIQNHIDKLSNSVDFLLSKDEQWQSLLTSLSGEALEREEAEYGKHVDANEGHYALIVQGQDKISELKSNIAELDSLAETYGSELQSSYGPPGSPGQPQIAPKQPIKLPKLDLPTFSGDSTQWPEFWALFKSSVDKQDISDVQKLAHLKTKVRGDAAAAIASYAVTDANYKTAVNVLKNRFGKDSIVINSLYAKLRNLKLSGSSTKELRSTLDYMEKCLLQLESMNEDLDQANLVDQLRGKLPAETLLEMQKLKMIGQEWTVDLIRQTLTQVIENQKEIQRIVQTQPKAPRGNQWQQLPKNQKQGTASYDPPGGSMSSMSAAVGKKDANNSRGKMGGKKKSRICVFCDDSHASWDCERYKNVAERKIQLFGKKPVHCIRCLQKGHMVSNCSFKGRCYYCKGDKHHSALCPKHFADTGAQMHSVSLGESCETPAKEQPSNEQKEQKSNVSGLLVNMSPKTNLSSVGAMVEKPVKTSMLMTATTKIRNPSKPNLIETAQLFFDPGAQRSFITDDMASKLKLPCDGQEELSIWTFAAEKPRHQTSKHVAFDTLLRDGNTLRIDADALPHLAGPQIRAAISKEDKGFIEKNLPVSFFADEVPFEQLPFNPDIVIGQDFFWDFMIDSPKTKLPSGLYAIPSKLGLFIAGKQWLNTYSEVNSAKKNGDMSMHVSVLVNSAIYELNDFQEFGSTDGLLVSEPNLEDFWKLESIGIDDSPVVKDDDVAMQQFNDTIQYQNGRYYVKWPYKSNITDLPDNKCLAFQRFKMLTYRFSQNADLLEKYSQIIEEQCHKGIIEPVFSCEEKNQCHYIPHHPVVTPLKTTTKVRIVYDGSAHTKNTLSLNDCLYRGPVILPDLVGLLLRFRLSPIAILSDVEKAFLMIGLQEPDRDLTRFYWYKDPSKPTVDNNLQIYRFCRVPFGIISSPFLLGATIQHHMIQPQTPVANLILNNVYVDNVIVEVQSEHEAVKFYKEAKDLFQSASMNLREWKSNSAVFNQSIPEKDLVSATVVKVLGLTWDTSQDCFIFKGPTMDITVPTKRSILKTVASVFDPMGLISPVMLQGKLFLQSLWKMSLGWDEPIPAHMENAWNDILSSFQELQMVTVHRYFGFQMEQPSELHVFVDASSKSYAAVVYLRQQNGESFTVKLIFSKVRLAPQKPTMTIPRLELMALLIGHRVLWFLKNQLSIKISKFFVWSDSQCCLQWLISKHVLARFVKNRKNEILAIQSKLGPVSTCYVSSENNPADIASKGSTTAQLVDSPIWWTGPQWISEPKEIWPEYNLPPVTPEVLEQVESEMTKQSQPLYSAPVLVPEKKNRENFLGIYLKKFSSLGKLLNVTVYSLRLAKYICTKFSKNGALEKFGEIFSRIECKLSGPVKPAEKEAASLYWHKVIQSEKYEVQITNLQGTTKVKESLTAQLGLYLDFQGVLRCKGRFSIAPLQETVKFPILLPKSNHFTELVIKEAHQKTFHSGVQQTLATLRSTYWLPQGRMLVRSILKPCAICKFVQGGPYSLPSMAPLPLERLDQAKPFQYTGLDYLGPIYFKSENEKKKSWVCLFTCFITRAVHLELVFDLSAKEFLNALRRFVARRGTPKKIISDNATQFQLAKDAVRKAWARIVTSDDVISYCTKESMEWEMITPFAPWKGGVYERLIGSTKSAMKKAVGKKLLDLNQMLTLLPEIEAVLNTRPLTYVYGEIDSPTVLRPVDFLLPKGQLGTPSSDEDPNDPDYVPKLEPPEKLVKYWHSTQAELDKFWKFWQQEYLSSLRERTQTDHHQPRIVSEFKPKVGDIVLIHQENLPRASWKLGKIQKLFTSKNGCVRSAEVLLPTRKSLSRPINLLYPLETATTAEIAFVKNVPNVETEKSEINAQQKCQTDESKNVFNGLSFAKVSLVPGMSFIFMVLCLFSLMQLSTSLQLNRTYQLCGGGRNGHALEVPQTIHCNLPANKPLRKKVVKIWIQREIPQRQIAYRCYTQKHTICTRTSIVGGRGIVGDVTHYSAVTPNTCWTVANTKQWQGKNLTEVTNGFWSTNIHLNVEYKWCCYDVKNSIENFILEIGEVASLDGEHLVTDLQDANSCSPPSGYCQDQERGTLIWNGTFFYNQCKYVKQGIYGATLSGLSVIVHQLQGAFSFSGRPHPPGSSCVPKDMFYSDQGAVFIGFVNGTPQSWIEKANRKHLNLSQENTDYEDLSSYRRLYLFKKILEIERQQFSLIWQQLCSIRQNQLHYVLQLLRISPTLGVRALLRRDDVHADWAGEALVFWTCKNVTAAVIHYSGQVNGTCYKYTPVQLDPDGKLYFVSPGSNDLIDHSPTEDCAHATQQLFKVSHHHWESVQGKAHVTDLPLELTWKGLWSSFTFDTPSLFLNLHSNFPVFSSISQQWNKILKFEHALKKLVTYTSDMSLDPDVVYNTLVGVGDAIGHLYEGTGKAIGHAVVGIADGVGGLFNNIIKGPFQLLINLIILAIILGLIFYVSYVYWKKYRKRKGAKLEKPTSVPAAAQKEEIEMIEFPVESEGTSHKTATTYKLRYH